MLQVVLDPCRDHPEDGTDRPHGHDRDPLRRQRQDERRDGLVGPGKGDDREGGGPHAISIGSVTSGAASARRAAQKWNGIAPKRIATATANPT